MREGHLETLLNTVIMPAPIQELLRGSLALNPSDRRTAAELWEMATSIRAEDMKDWDNPVPSGAE
jgi:hypothetical protein